MKKIKKEEDNIFSDFPDSLVKLIKESLDTDDYSKKVVSRETLVKMGNTIIPQMHKLLDSDNDALRMEAAKIVELIADRRSISFLLILLDDKIFDIRWIAAEALIKIGRRSICPLLKSIRDGKGSLIFLRGSHHILISLLSEEEKGQLVHLLQSLDNYNELSEIAPAQASIALKTVFRCNS